MRMHSPRSIVHTPPRTAPRSCTYTAALVYRTALCRRPTKVTVPCILRSACFMLRTRPPRPRHECETPGPPSAPSLCTGHLLRHSVGREGGGLSSLRSEFMVHDVCIYKPTTQRHTPTDFCHVFPPAQARGRSSISVSRARRAAVVLRAVFASCQCLCLNMYGRTV